MKTQTQTQREDSYGKIEAEIGIMLPPKTGRGKEGSSSGPSERAWPCQHLDCGLLASAAARDEISAVLKLLSLWYFVMQS